MNLPVLSVWDEASQDYVAIPAIKGKDGHTPQRGVDYWTEEDRQDVIDSVSESILANNIDTLLVRYSQTATFGVGTYTDVDFDIYKEGYTVVSIMPRTSGSKDVLIVGYGFYDDGGLGDIDYSKATVTYSNISNAEVTGGCNLDVCYIKEATFAKKEELLQAVLDSLGVAEEAVF